MMGRTTPVTGYPAIDTVAIKKIDATTFEEVLKKTGKEVGRVAETISKDGKTRTMVHKGTDAKGQAFTATWVYDKQ